MENGLRHMRPMQWSQRTDLALVALIALVAIGLSWELLSARPVSLPLRPGLTVLVVLQVAAIGLALLWRARAARERAGRLEDRREVREAADLSRAVLDSASGDVAVSHAQRQLPLTLPSRALCRLQVKSGP